jgi:stage III sporulation protein AD
MDIFQLAAIALVSVVLILTIKNHRPDIALLLAVGVGVFFLVSSMGKVKTVIDAVNDFSTVAGIDGEHIGIIFRITGIAYVTEFIAEVCRDAGENSIASKLEIAGKITILTMAIPIMVYVMNLLASLIR